MDSFENYDLIRGLADGNEGRVTRLMWYKPTGELVVMEFIPRDDCVDQHVLREIVNHRSLCSPNVILLHRAFLTLTLLALAMDFASGGELLDLISRASPLPEPAVCFLFHQLIHLLQGEEKRDAKTLESEAESPGAGSHVSSSSFRRKVARSRSVGCGSRSFSGDFLERISTGFGDCTL
ncbi:uncharacterized protein A4U43_C06F11870 [Asparagus officinalis]|uniref:Protein kinase domain-containing protein n=1 Tax=Asparagus officinalis TaxID=4686 RepID=A0A5P1EL94_ASPOF|nr:uncharacterized protein A4U43_C06F11870 [Asparagus officinalis]